MMKMDKFIYYSLGRISTTNIFHISKERSYIIYMDKHGNYSLIFNDIMIELLTFSFLIFRKFEIILYIKTYYQNIFHVTKFSLKFLQRLVVNIKE